MKPLYVQGSARLGTSMYLHLTTLALGDPGRWRCICDIENSLEGAVQRMQACLAEVNQIHQWRAQLLAHS